MKGRSMCKKNVWLPMIGSGHALKIGETKSFWRSTIFDHLSSCGFGDYINMCS